MSTKIEDLSVAQVVEAVRKLAEERPDFAYWDQPERKAWLKANGIDNGFARCSYLGAYAPRNAFDGGSEASYEGEGCIVGQALSSLGVSDADLRSIEGEGAGFLPMRGGRSAWLIDVQVKQDAGLSWSDAVKHADRMEGN